MSWLSQGLQDVGLGGVNTFFNSAIKPALENPAVDIGLGLGAAALTGGLLAPEIGGLFAGGAADAGAAAGGGALGFAGDVGGGAASGLPDWLAAPGAISDASGGAAFPTTGVAGGATGGTSLGGSLATDVGNAAGVGGGYTTQPFVTNPGVMDTPGFGQPAPEQPGILQSLTNQATQHPLQTAAAAAGVGGLGFNLLQGYQQKQQLNALQKQENTLSGNAQASAAAATAAAGPELSLGELAQSYLQTGTLPAPIQSQVDQQTAAAKAQIIQGYASRGQSTDPNQNSALAQDLANVDTQALTLKGNLESQLNQARHSDGVDG